MAEPLPGSIPVGDTGKSLDTTVVETTEGDVHREVVVVADPADADALGEVTAGAPNNEGYGPTVHDPGVEFLSLQLGLILDQLTLMNTHLNYMTEIDK